MLCMWAKASVPTTINIGSTFELDDVPSGAVHDYSTRVRLGKPYTPTAPSRDKDRDWLVHWDRCDIRGWPSVLEYPSAGHIARDEDSFLSNLIKIYVARVDDPRDVLFRPRYRLSSLDSRRNPTVHRITRSSVFPSRAGIDRLGLPDNRVG